MSEMDGTPIPDEPTVRDVLAMLGRTYTKAGVIQTLMSPRPTLEGRVPIDLLDTPAGRREVYGWALSLAEGVFT